MTDLREQLISAGMSEAEASNKVRIFERTESALKASGVSPSAEVRRIYVPGRIEFLGKHTDYAGGRSLICALERGICAVYRPRSDRQLTALDAIHETETTFGVSDTLRSRPGHWINYPLTVARRLAANFPGELFGADVGFASDLPPASGMSSSSALIVALFQILADVNSLEQHEDYQRNIRTGADLAAYLGAVECGQSFGSLSGDLGVGTAGGSQDHTAILLSQPGKLVQYSFCPVRYEREVGLSNDLVFVIASSGVTAEKTREAMEKYNRVSDVARTVLSLWNNATGRNDSTLAAAVSSAPDAVEQIRGILSTSSSDAFTPSELIDRFEQFYLESFQIIPGAGDALARGDLESLGKFVDQSQNAAETMLGNQVAETEWLASSARELGAVAASAFGAGFGGSVWALVRREDSAEFSRQWASQYKKQFPHLSRLSRFFTTLAGPGFLKL